MSNITVNFNNIVGKMKPMHSVNNGPVTGGFATKGNVDGFKEIGIPYARNHDDALCSSYGGHHCVDISAIFPDFDADVNDENSYDFVVTDAHIKTTVSAGTEVFYRLGQSIEHYVKKYNIYPPKDFKKWAEICEHIIMHYNEGWANGFHYNFKYWEIWNEPDLDPSFEIDKKRTWCGTDEQYHELYRVTATHLKERFPDLKIGGPSLARYVDTWMEPFLEAITKDGKKVPLDFFSWHCYGTNPDKILEREAIIREKLDKFGYYDTESICTEWSYVKNFREDFIYSIKSIWGIKGASFVSSTMLGAQNSTMDMLMYYTLIPNAALNIMFEEYTYEKRKGYFAYLMFSKLYKLKNHIETICDDKEIYVAGATNGEKNALMFTYFNDDDNSPSKTVTIKGLGKGEHNYYKLSKDETMEKHTVSVEDELTLELDLFDVICFED